VKTGPRFAPHCHQSGAANKQQPQADIVPQKIDGIIR